MRNAWRDRLRWRFVRIAVGLAGAQPVEGHAYDKEVTDEGAGHHEYRRPPDQIGRDDQQGSRPDEVGILPGGDLAPGTNDERLACGIME